MTVGIMTNDVLTCQYCNVRHYRWDAALHKRGKLFCVSDSKTDEEQIVCAYDAEDAAAKAAERMDADAGGEPTERDVIVIQRKKSDADKLPVIQAVIAQISFEHTVDYSANITGALVDSDRLRKIVGASQAEGNGGDDGKAP